MSGSDEVGGGGWQIAPETLRALRLQAARQALRRRDFRRATIEAEELLDDDPQDVDGLFLVAESAMELRDHEVALQAWHTLAGLVDRPSVWVQLGVCAFETCAFEEARDAARQALARCDDLGEAWYLLGLCAERLESSAVAWEHFERAHRCSPLAFPIPLTLSDGDVRDVIDEALARISPDLARFWGPVPLRIELLPDPTELRGTIPPISPRVIALYAGHPPAEPDGRTRPPALRVYRGNLVHHDSRETAIEALADALEQEALDWLPGAAAS